MFLTTGALNWCEYVFYGSFWCNMNYQPGKISLCMKSTATNLTGKKVTDNTLGVVAINGYNHGFHNAVNLWSWPPK
jgi:hypothetical protein